MNQIYKIAKRYGKGNRARTCAAAFLAALALTGVMGMSEAQASTVTGDDGQIGGVVINHGIYYKNTALRDGSLYLGDTSGNYSQITPKSAKLGQVTIDDKGYITGANYMQTNALNSKYNFSVGKASENGTMPFFVSSTGDFYAANNKFSVNKDGKVTAAAGKIGKVTIDENGNVAGANSIQTNALNAKYNLSVGTANENGTVPFFVNSNGAFYAANGKLVVDKDGNVTAGNVVLKNGVYTGNSKLIDGELYVGDADGNYSQITPKSAKLGKVTIDENGYITGANSIQTNALNAKYNLSVGTANENGTVPFFVNSNGAFYAANGKLVVDKDGKVTATEGEIGGVKINKGISYKNTSLRDGSLYLGDDQGHYSQISPEYVKLGKVTINKEGKITGVAAGAVTADSTDAVNGSQLHAVATEAGKHSKVVNGSKHQCRRSRSQRTEDL